MVIEAATTDTEDDKNTLLGQQSQDKWRVLLPACKLSAHKQHYFPMERLAYTDRVTHIRVRMFPDGGISRIGILGRYDKDSC